MEAPPVRYATTSDGFRIAYEVSGQGLTLVYVPFSIQSLGHVNRENWGQHPQLSKLAAALRLVRYDTRGQGLSTRGLGDDHSIEAYERDLEAVISQLGVEEVALIGGTLASHIALRYASHHPEQVSALILYFTGIKLAETPALNQGLAASDWQLFLHSFLGMVQANETISPDERREAVSRMSDSVNQADWLQYARVAEASDISDEAPRVRVPTLVLATGGHLTISQQGAAAVASLIPNARLVHLDEAATIGATVPPVLEFLAELPATEAPSTDTRRPTVPALSLLSLREVEILRLVAAGKSSREIGEELVLSRRTVERHIANIYLKTETHGRAQVAVYARESGLF